MLVQSEAVKDRKILRDLFLGLLFLDGLSVALDVTELVKDITILINPEPNEALSIAFNNLADNVLILIGNLAVSDNT